MPRVIGLPFSKRDGIRLRYSPISPLISVLGVLLQVTLALLLIFVFCDNEQKKVELRNAELRNQQLRDLIRSQGERITRQQAAMDHFSGRMDQLDADLAGMDRLEQEIRAVAALDEESPEKQYFGMGGPRTDDFDPERLHPRNRVDPFQQMDDRLEEIAIASLGQQYDLRSLLDSAKRRQRRMASTPSVWPVEGFVTSTFGGRKSPFSGQIEFHKGIDIGAPLDTPIIAPADGVVTFVGRKRYYGAMLVIHHGYGIATRYGHVGRILKMSREKVKRGEVVALVGNSGRSTGPHLHYEVRVDGEAIDPEGYFPR